MAKSCEESLASFSAGARLQAVANGALGTVVAIEASPPRVHVRWDATGITASTLPGDVSLLGGALPPLVGEANGSR